MSHRVKIMSAAGGVATVLAMVALAGCSTGSGSDEKSSGGAAVSSTAREPAAADNTSLVNRPVPRTKAVIKTGQLSITSDHLGEVRSEVDDLLQSLGGSVDREDATNDRQGRIERSTLVLRVPVGSFDTARRALGRLGKVSSSNESEKDVTTEVIDTAERVQTLQNSLDRLQKFQRSAEDVGDLIRFEDQITSRQAELQSLKAQQSYLSSQTSMSTITLTLSRPGEEPPGALDDAGFVAGLRAGWHTLGSVLVVATTVVGALLPFLVVLALLGVPLFYLARTVRARRGVSSASDTRQSA
jgi:hypothetical protein